MRKKALHAGDKAALLNAASGECYNPKCSEQLVVWRAGIPVVNFDIAHIRDELPPTDATGDLGWRYWPDDDLTQDDRNRFENLLLLCKPCHKLIDQSDPRSYDVDLLHRWKSEAESGLPIKRLDRILGIDPKRMADMIVEVLSGPPTLKLAWPRESVDVDLLSFAARQTLHIGRESDLQGLVDFLRAPDPFLWWLVVGEAGTGKSRLALEFCLAFEDAWHTGFITEAGQEALLGFEPNEPTLIVIDYAAARARWIGDALLDLAVRSAQFDCPVRVLILERSQSEPWYSRAVRAHRHTESKAVLSRQYAAPLHLSQLSENDLRLLIGDLATSRGYVLTTTEIEDVLERTVALDPLRRPLFAMAATLEHSEGDDESGSRDELLRSVLKRRAAQRDALAGGAAPWITEIEIIATSVGGVEPSRYADLLGARAATDQSTFPSLAELRASGLTTVLSGVLPDILGELSVLDALAGSDPVTGEIAASGLRLGWRFDPTRYAAFVERAAEDHPWHPALVELMAVKPESGAESAVWFDLAPALVPLLRSSTNPGLLRLKQLMNEYGGASAGQTQKSHARFEFHLGSLFLQEKKLADAVSIYSEVINAGDPTWDAVPSSLTNRGVAFMAMNRVELALADFTRVIDAAESSDESKACCLNNRADIRSRRGDDTGSMADRTAVLDLTATTFNRRYIAYARRAQTLWDIGEIDKAFEDLDAILAEGDIVMEQKLATRLTRAQWRIQLGNVQAAAEDLHEVLAGRRNFEGVAADAQAILESLEDQKSDR